MTTQRITADRELAQLRSSVARSQVHASKLRERSTQPSVEDIAERMRNARERVPAGEGKPIPAEVTAESARTLHAILTGTPDLATRALGEQFDSVWRTTESVVEGFYSGWPELRWFDLLTGADDRLRKPANDAAEAFKLTTAPGLPAIVATSRPSQPWVMNSPEDFETACDAIAGDTHCDLQISGPTVIRRKRYRNCVDWFASLRADELTRRGSSYYADELIERSFTTLPVARGDLIVLVRVCCWCLGAYMYQNGVDLTKCIVEEPYSDGFGALPWNESLQTSHETDCDTDEDKESADDDGDDFTDVDP